MNFQSKTYLLIGLSVGLGSVFLGMNKKFSDSKPLVAQRTFTNSEVQTAPNSKPSRAESEKYLKSIQSNPSTKDLVEKYENLDRYLEEHEVTQRLSDPNLPIEEREKYFQVIIEHQKLLAQIAALQIEESKKLIETVSR